MPDKKLCPVCASGFLTECCDKTEQTYRGITRQLDSYYSVCDHCESEMADEKQVKRNKEIMIAFKDEVESACT